MIDLEKITPLLDDDGDPIIWRGDISKELMEKCANPKCDNKATEHGTFCDKHGGVIAGC
jgi:hypothetical protein